ncbi:hypothetical protein JIR001_21360 [Polycladomyces abyssicola]|uniref:Uncharacterized protein n=1 Tax=Polycladomyces abyssicola TaxID=1125966 RepID=A0A8D5ZPH4_9BACL|nr:hypothetical protein JIR001_21360 [Polycladomyces abyssicola]
MFWVDFESVAGGAGFECDGGFAGATVWVQPTELTDSNNDTTTKKIKRETILIITISPSHSTIR